MPASDRSVYQNQKVQITKSDGIPIRSDLLLTNDKGEEDRGARKRAGQALEKLRPALQRILLSDETVLAVVPATSPLSTLEQFTSTWWTLYLAACRIVVTNRRILLLPVKRDGSWRESVRAVQWGDLDEVNPVALLGRNLRFRFKNGAKLTFTRLRRADAKKIAVIASVWIPASAGELSAAQGTAQLCPDCCSVLTLGQYSCVHCGLGFKDEKTMVMRSIFLPGGGYFYTGHPFIAIIPAVVEGVLLVEVLTLLALALRSANAKPFLSALLILGLFWGLETAVTILHCRRYIRDYIPLKRDGSGPFQVPQAKIGA